MPPRRQSLRRTRVTLVAFGLAFAGLTPSALAATGEPEESPTPRTEDTDASTALEPTETAARITEAASEAAERGSTAVEASAAAGSSSSDHDADTRGGQSDDSANSTYSSPGEDGEARKGREGDETAAVDEDEDGEPSSKPAVDSSTSDVADRASQVEEEAATAVVSTADRAAETVLEQAQPVVKKAPEKARETGAATKLVIGEAGVIAVGGLQREGADAPSKPPPGSEQGATAASAVPAASGEGPRVGGAPGEPLPGSNAPGPVRLPERSVRMPATPASPPPAPRGRARAGHAAHEDGRRQHARPRQAGSASAPLRPDPFGSTPAAPLGDSAPSGGSPSVPGGGASSISPASGAAAALIAAFCLTAPSLLRRLRLSPALVRPVAFVSLLERPG